MIEKKTGNILSSDVEALVNTVNCVGVMGRGIALQFRKAFPRNYEDYKAICDRKKLHPGMVLTHEMKQLHNPQYIINFPTKRHWKGNSRIEDIASGLEALVAEIRQRNIRSIAIPALGCGLGGLNWSEVRPMIERALSALPDVRVFLYEPSGTPMVEEMAKERKKPEMTIGRAVLLCLMRRYLGALMDPSVSLLEIHKLMYFMQEAGESLQLRYQKAMYGPYAENLRHVLNLIEGHFISGYGDAEDNPDKQIELLPDAAEHAEVFLRSHPLTHKRFDRVTELIEGFETPFGMELLATEHWIAKHEGVRSDEEAIAKTYAWNARKRMYKEAHIRLARETLRRKDWITLN